MKYIAILGSTGSIGTQTLDVVRRNPSMFQVSALSAHHNVDLLIEQALEFKPSVVCIADESYEKQLRLALKDQHTRILIGEEGLEEMAALPANDIVVAAMVGFAGLRPTITAIKAGKTIALANKETMVVAGEMVCRLAQQHRARILPIDSEHSAIFQCLAAEHNHEVEKILLTASGGPFRQTPLEDFPKLKAVDALKHPNWQMGAKITIDSATMMNKGFEVIEAHWLFNIAPEKIEVVVHPESIVHSAVQFQDGSVKAQLAMPDMRMPIQYALSYPWRLKSDFPRINLFELKQLTFEQPDLERFPCLDIAYKALEKGGTMPCAINAANEVLVDFFLQSQIKFPDIAKTLQRVLNEYEVIEKPRLDDLMNVNDDVRELVCNWLGIRPIE